MNQEDKDWLELGQHLNNYQPEGDPEQDFLALQELDKAGRKRRTLLGFFFENLGSIVLLLLFGWVALSVFQSELDRKAKQRAKLAQQELVAPVNLVTVPAATTTENIVNTAGKQADLSEGTTTELPLRSPVSTTKPTSTGEGTPIVALTTATFSLPSASESKAADQSQEAPQLPMMEANIVPQNATVSELVASSPPLVAIVPVSSLALAPLVPKEFSPRAPKIAAGISRSATTSFTLGAGLSNHWRGANFWEEVDRGIYAYMGLERKIGQRLSLEGRIGYRGHGMQVPVFSDTDKPWSYFTDEVHSPDQAGVMQAYIYEGIVKGYRAVEFSLLANYSVGNRWQFSAGGRYSLPALEFHRNVHGPDDQNPFHDFIEGTELVRYVDYGALMGVNYRVSRHLMVETSLHLGMVDLINNVAEHQDRFNHSSSVSIGLRYVLE